MELTLNHKQTGEDLKAEQLLRMLDRGIEDMEMGRELPLDEAFERIADLRMIRRNARA